MLKKNNFISIKNFYDFGVGKKTIHKVYKKAGINFRPFKFYLKDTRNFRIKNLLNSKLIGKNLKKREYQFKTFISKLKISHKKI